jgi:hypothetical protein
MLVISLRNPENVTDSVRVNKMLHLPGSCFEVDWLIRPSFREGFDLQDMFDPYKTLQIPTEIGLK